MLMFFTAIAGLVCFCLFWGLVILILVAVLKRLNKP